MRTFQKILFPIDLSDTCTAAAPWVEKMAKKFQAEVELLHVLEMPPAYFSDWYGYTAVIDTDAIRDARINEVGSYFVEKFQRLQVRREVVE
jgi:nucleotide-binding universal stress UspA family protein